MAISEYLNRIVAFNGMNGDQLSAIQAHCRELEYQVDDKLFAQGDEARHLWFVVEGQVDLYFELPGADRRLPAETTMSSMKAKDTKARTLGWSCFVPPFEMRLSAYCVSRTCKVIRIKKQDLLELFDKDHKMGYQFLTYLVQVVGYRFHQFQDEVARQRGESILSGW